MTRSFITQASRITILTLRIITPATPQTSKRTFLPQLRTTITKLQSTPRIRVCFWRIKNKNGRSTLWKPVCDVLYLFKRSLWCRARGVCYRYVWSQKFILRFVVNGIQQSQDDLFFRMQLVVSIVSLYTNFLLAIKTQFSSATNRFELSIIQPTYPHYHRHHAFEY